MHNSEFNHLPHVIIIGAGFGGLRAARALAHAPARVTIVDKNNYHLFQPLLYQVATSGISPDEIAHPVRSILREQKNLEFRLGEVHSIDLANKFISASFGDLPFDYLILAVGGVTQYFGIESIEHNAFGLKDIQDATAIRSHLLRMFELANEEPDETIRQSLLTFVIVGGGPTGVEMAGAVSELTRVVLAKDYPRMNSRDVRVVLVEAFDHLLPAFPTALRENAVQVLRKKQVDILFNTSVVDYDGKRVKFKGDNELKTETVIWAAGVKAPALVSSLGVPLGSLGRVIVEPSLQIKAYPFTYVIGDAAFFLDDAGKPLPMVAPVAMQQADVAARNILAAITGKNTLRFVYKDPGILATIGRNQAVARLGAFQFKGFIAWLVWLFVHLMQLVGFRNRLLVLLNWVWDYLFYDRAVRLIDSKA